VESKRFYYYNETEPKFQSNISRIAKVGVVGIEKDRSLTRTTGSKGKAGLNRQVGFLVCLEKPDSTIEHRYLTTSISEMTSFIGRRGLTLDKRSLDKFRYEGDTQRIGPFVITALYNPSPEEVEGRRTRGEQPHIYTVWRKDENARPSRSPV